jgi:formylglycine-generating enzyme required for sulfatase activity
MSPVGAGMSFNIDEWKNKLVEELQGWQMRIVVSGYEGAFYFFAAAALIPVVRAFQSGDKSSAVVFETLLDDTVGTHLLTNLIPSFGKKTCVEIAQILQTEAGQTPGMKAEMDALLIKLDVLQQAEMVLPRKQGYWFKEIVRQEGAKLNTLDRMQFCHVPAGKFIMGNGKGELDLPDYWIGRYLVTGAQYACFVEAGGYENPLYWTEAQEVGVWQDGSVKGRWDRKPRQGPQNYDSPLNSMSHLVVGITWYEMVAFTRWLDEMWQSKGILSPSWQVGLPSEAEWEKAARGGLAIPPKAIIQVANELGQVKDWQVESSEQEIVPLAVSQPQKGKQDISDVSGTDNTSALENYLEANSPYGMMETEGVVWEWTRSIWRDLPYQLNDGREDLKNGEDRVLRGGALYENEKYTGCAYREGGNPSYWYFYVGFRIAIFPALYK